MRITLHQLKVFDTVATHTGFSRASRVLHLTQPTVSMQVKQLADAVGAPFYLMDYVDGAVLRTREDADVLTPAIGYAEHGHPLVERANATIATVEELFRVHWPTSAAVYLPGGKVPATGTLKVLMIAPSVPRRTKSVCPPGTRLCASVLSDPVA